ncbi:MAG: pentapeptide repeat-containing protein [Acidobacteriota bacterium]|nr:pentapeptide repeat-containing protein [Acidobacteriota bacterium]
MSIATTPLLPALPALQVRAQFLEDVPEPLRLDKVRIDGDLDLSLRTIKRPIHISGAEFAGTFDFRNARFSSTLRLENCDFEKPVNGGDRELSSCVCESDLSFQDSRFKGKAWFFGLECKGSGNFRNCSFLETQSGDFLQDELQPADFTEASFAKELSMVRAQFHGRTSFNSMKCGMAGYFREARFGIDNPDASVDFVGSSFGLVCDLSRAVLFAAATFEGLSAGLALDLRLSRFLKSYAGMSVSFDYVSTTHLLMYGAILDCDVSFSGISCKGDARIDGASVSDDMQFELTAGPVPEDLRARLGGAYIAIEDSASLEQRPAGWFLHTSKDGAAYELRVILDPSGNGKRQLVIPTTFLGRVAFTNSSFGGNIRAAGAIFSGPVSFKGFTCGGGAYFESAFFKPSTMLTQEDRDKDCIDFSFCSCGLNFQFAHADFRRPVSFESATIKSGLLLSESTFAEGLNLTSASMHTLNVGDGSALVAGRSRLDNFHFDIFEALDPVNTWKNVVAAQNPKQFTRDPYQMLETYFRGKGMRHLADGIYFAGRHADRSFIGPGSPRKRFLDTLAWIFTGYGVQLRRLGIGIALFLALGTAVFWDDAALAPAKPEAAAAVHAKAPPPPVFVKFCRRFGYSLGSLLPLVDLHLSKDWEPVGDCRRAYLALHIAVGWILFPLLLAGITAQLNKN